MSLFTKCKLLFQYFKVFCFLEVFGFYYSFFYSISKKDDRTLPTILTHLQRNLRIFCASFQHIIAKNSGIINAIFGFYKCKIEQCSCGEWNALQRSLHFFFDASILSFSPNFFVCSSPFFDRKKFARSLNSIHSSSFEIRITDISLVLKSWIQLRHNMRLTHHLHI